MTELPSCPHRGCSAPNYETAAVYSMSGLINSSLEIDYSISDKDDEEGLHAETDGVVQPGSNRN